MSKKKTAPTLEEMVTALYEDLLARQQAEQKTTAKRAKVLEAHRLTADQQAAIQDQFDASCARHGFVM